MAYSTINPATGEQLLTFDTLSDAELDQGLETAHTAYTHWRRRPVHERAEILKVAAAELRANSKTFRSLGNYSQSRIFREVPFRLR